MEKTIVSCLGYMPGTCESPLFWGLNPLKQGPFQVQGPFSSKPRVIKGFQVGDYTTKIPPKNMLYLRNEKYNVLFRAKKGVDYDYTTQLYEDYNIPLQGSRIPIKQRGFNGIRKSCCLRGSIGVVFFKMLRRGRRKDTKLLLNHCFGWSSDHH